MSEPTPELKPCPHCSAPAVLIDGKGHLRYSVACGNRLCGQALPDKAEVVRQWNLRAPEAEVARLKAENAATRSLLDVVADAPLKLEIAQQTIATLKAENERLRIAVADSPMIGCKRCPCCSYLFGCYCHEHPHPENPNCPGNAFAAKDATIAGMQETLRLADRPGFDAYLLRRLAAAEAVCEHVSPYMSNDVPDETMDAFVAAWRKERGDE